MKIISAYTQTELDLDVVETQDPETGRVMCLIKHDSLRDVIYNQLALTAKGSVSYRYILADRDHSVVECTIDDGEGRVVTEIGESVFETLDSNISKSYPTLIATQRAFDRAVILLLKLSGKYLSNLEMGECLTFDFEPSVAKDELIENNQSVDNTVVENTIVENSSPIDDTEDDEPYVDAPIAEDAMMTIPEGIDNVVDAPIDATPEEAAAPAEEVPAEPVDNTARLAELGAIIFGKGKYEGKPDTIEQIYASDGGEFFRKLLALKSPAPSLAESLVYVKEYMSLVQ